MKMDLRSGYKGVVGLVFGNESSSDADSYVERLLDRISNGKLGDDRRNAIIELQAVVSENQASQLAFGAMGFPVMLSVLKEEREDVEMVTNFSSLSCLLSNCFVLLKAWALILKSTISY
ncbi:hypothetical protein Ahy_A05g023517 isoform C [Arachis hypogaea]|uniref:Uncharacterized protein n=1 Tax=Arachis hypogaea TaxID=3818 RepID=A0A445D3P0_ARAHY|nr:hypothetical protein Ahy_A05g023517 isoform C [Arachis hypogaea]